MMILQKENLYPLELNYFQNLYDGLYHYMIVLGIESMNGP